MMRILCILIFLISFSTRSSHSAIIKDYEIEEIINILIEPILVTSKIDLQKPYFYIVLSDIPNAHVDELNRIFITTEFITTVDPEGLVGVIAHEIAHIKLNHAKKRIQNLDDKKSILEIAKIISLSASIVSNDPSIFIGSNIATSEILKRNLSSYSIDQEREADLIALKYLENSRISFLFHKLIKMYS